MEGTMDSLALTRHFASRLRLMCWAHGQRMKRAEFEFMAWMKPSTAEEQDARWNAYRRESRKAGRMMVRHSQMAHRALNAHLG